MRKSLLGILVSIVMLSALSGFAEEGEFPLFFTPEGKITIDGVRDDWPATVPFVIESDSQIRTGSRKSLEEFNVTVWCFFDAQNMYLFAEVGDAMPLKNQFQGNDLYKGDSLEGYVGFRDEARASFGPTDFQFGLGLSDKGAETWLWTKSQKLVDTQIAIAPTPKGYTVEARIPLANFGITQVKAGDPIWLDFAANNSIGEDNRATQMIWHGDGSGWQSPKVWRKGRLTDDAKRLNAPYILTPPELLVQRTNRVAVWYNGKPWQGSVTVGAAAQTTDERGGLTIIPETEGSVTIAATIDGQAVTDAVPIKSRMLATEQVTLAIAKIKVNQQGYLPDEPKQFALTDTNGELTSKSFLVINQNGGGAAYRGTLQETPVQDAMTGETVYYADFSALQTPGVYTIRVKNFDKSYPFAIHDRVFGELFYTTMRSYYLQRCGVALNDPISKVAHAICHTQDGVMRANAQETREVTGGWHDAGDYGKYMPTAGVTVAQLLMLYELAPQKFMHFSLDLPESANNRPDLLDEVKYELDWMLKMQAAGGGVFHKVNTPNFPGMVLPEQDTQPRYIYEKGTADTGIFTGAVALAARVWQPVDAAYAEKLKKAALLSGEFLLANLDKPVLWPSNDNTGAYKTADVTDELFWAFAELYRLTGEEKYLNAALPLRKPGAGFPEASWENTLAFGLYALVRAEKTPEIVRTDVSDAIFLDAKDLAAYIQQNGYHVALTANQFNWASNKTACALGLNLILAYELFKNAEFKHAARAQLDYVLGVNTLSKSFITGVGTDGVRYPHHRLVESSHTLVPGLLVGGPNTNAEDGVYPKGLGARGYVDDTQSYASNEYAIDYNAPLVFLAGYFMK